jgi:hemoglobin
MKKPDLDSPQTIRQFVDKFYACLLADKKLAPIFLDVAQVDLELHKPLICQYWEKLLLGSDEYQRHTMNIHRLVDQKQKLEAADFEAWLSYFVATVDSHFAGPKADRAKHLASAIAANMQKSFLANA